LFHIFYFFQCGQLLYRLRNGEFPEELEAKVFWILIGVNDLGLDGCSAEAVAAGNIRIVEEIQSLRPSSKIVVNSILPFSPEGERDEDLSEHPKWQVASQVNHLLECFADATDNVEFFNATKIFMTDDELHTKRAFYVDAVHPSAKGSRAWAREIEEKVFELTGHD
jgi:lysophospholipase L1-like esterase